MQNNTSATYTAGGQQFSKPNVYICIPLAASLIKLYYKICIFCAYSYRLRDYCFSVYNTKRKTPLNHIGFKTAVFVHLCSVLSTETLKEWCRVMYI